MSPTGGARRRPSILAVIIGLGLMTAAGCNITRTAARFAAPILKSGTLAFESETDARFAEQAAPSNLKLLEGLLLEAPDDQALLTLAARGYATYAFGFLEPKLEAARIEAPSEVPILERRMEMFYSRALEYGQRALRRGLAEALDGSDEAFNEALAKQKAKDVPQIFWAAYALGSLIQLDVTNPQRLATFPRVQAMMARVVELDEAYYFAGAHLFFGILYAHLPPGGGGDTDASMVHLNKVQALTGGQLLMADVLKARFLAVRLQDYEMYEAALNRALTAPPGNIPEARLANELARERARFYLDNADAFFLDIPSQDAMVPIEPAPARPSAPPPVGTEATAP